MTHPRFDEPNYTSDADEVFSRSAFNASALVGLSECFGGADPLPELTEPSAGDIPLVTGPVDETLVPVAHRRVRVLSNYWHAGWKAAIPETYLRAEAARRLGLVADALPDPWGLAVFDAWRPLELQQQLFDAAYEDPSTEPDFMAPVSHDPASPPPHFSGGAVDVTLTFDGEPLALGSLFDDPTARAFTASVEDTPSAARTLRRVLYRSMRAQGFVVFAFEWWHFEWGTRRWAAITGEPPIYGAASRERYQK